MYVRVYVCVLLGACQCARAQEQRKVRAERNTEKTLVKGKRPLCLPFQSNPPPLSPLSFSLCPRFGSSCSLPAKPSLLPPPLSFARSLFSSPSLSLSLFLSPTARLPVRPSPSSDLRLTHPEERENFAILFSRFPLGISVSSLFPFLSPPPPPPPPFFPPLHPVYLKRMKEGSTKRAVLEGERQRERAGEGYETLLFLRSTSRTVSSPLLPPSLSVSSPSDFPRYYPANLTTLTFLFPLLRFDLPCTPLLPLSPFTFPLLLSSLRSLSPFDFAILLLHLRLCSFVNVSRLSPSAPLLLLPLSCTLYRSHPSLFRSPTTLPCLSLSSLFLISPLFRISCFCFKENVGSMQKNVAEEEER